MDVIFSCVLTQLEMNEHDKDNDGFLSQTEYLGKSN